MQQKLFLISAAEVPKRKLTIDIYMEGTVNNYAVLFDYEPPGKTMCGRRPDILRTSPYGPTGNVKERLGTYPQWDVFEKLIEFFLDFLKIFSWFQLYARHCTAKISKKPDMFCFGPVMVRDVSTKKAPLVDVFRTWCAGWDVTGEKMFLFHLII